MADRSSEVGGRKGGGGPVTMPMRQVEVVCDLAALPEDRPEEHLVKVACEMYSEHE